MHAYRLHIPSEVTVTEDDVAALSHYHDIPGSLVSGQRLLATYVNYYTANKVVVVPQFGQPKWDAEAMKTLGALYPGREIIGVQSREILLGGGNIHCATHQVPLCQ
jgi:agmatine deiminase